MIVVWWYKPDIWTNHLKLNMVISTTYMKKDYEGKGHMITPSNFVSLILLKITFSSQNNISILSLASIFFGKLLIVFFFFLNSLYLRISPFFLLLFSLNNITFSRKLWFYQESLNSYFSLHIKYATAIWRDAFQNFVSFTLKIPKMNNNKKICILYENI